MFNTPVTGSCADGSEEAAAAETATAMPDDDGELNLNIPRPVLKLQPCEGTGLGQDAASTLATNLKASFEVPTWPLDNLFPSIDIIERLRKQSEVKDLPSFQRGLWDLPFAGVLDTSSGQLDSELESKCCFPTPYFIPELEKLSADSVQDKLTVGLETTRASAIEAHKATAVEESNLPGTEDSTLHKSEEESILGIQETNPNQIENEAMNSPKVESIYSSKSEDNILPKVNEDNLPNIEEINLPKKEENFSLKQEEINIPKIGEIYSSKIDESIAVEILPPNSPQMLQHDPVLLPGILPEKRILISHPLPLQDGQLCEVLVEEPKLSQRMGFIRSLVGGKPLLKPSIRLSFGDRKMRKQIDSDSKEALKQNTCAVLKSLIFSIKLAKKIDTTISAKMNERRQLKMDKKRNSLTYSHVFRKNIFRLNAAAQNLREENIKCCGDVPSIMPVPTKPEQPDLNRIDASEGLSCRGLSASKDSVLSDSCESDDSFDQNKSELVPLRKVTAMIDPRQIEEMGRRAFSQYVKLYCFNSFKEWKRQGEGKIEIWDFQAKFYIILRDESEGELLLHMNVDEQWTIEYMSNNSYSCRWTNFNYATSRDGILERIACIFRQPSHAAEFVARIRHCAIRSRSE
ncbi:uncharacterized protein Sprn isoform X2 [Drosophila bipectinata]|uniref:uncharacterized protein Sprn isoform X2 n=1 Tax=Drosophila bipectinata TaxID=42026 RepID=UPI0038B279E7